MILAVGLFLESDESEDAQGVGNLELATRETLLITFLRGDPVTAIDGLVADMTKNLMAIPILALTCHVWQ